MHSQTSYADGIVAKRTTTGIVIPVYFPDDTNPGPAAGYLRDTTLSYLEQVDDPAHICISVDGAAHGEKTAGAIARELGVSFALSPINRGKFQGAATGVAHLIAAHPQLKYLAIVDMDGDHFANELLNFVRTAIHVQGQNPDHGVLVLGARTSKHRPMGFPRGELEEIADRVLLDALAYHAAVSGQPLALQYTTLLEEYPDFHSGYKLFDRATAEAVFLGDPILAGAPEDAYYRHGVETTMCVEAMLAGAILATVNRSTINEQPVSTFGLFHRQELVANKLIWAVKRLNIPPHFVRQWYDNHLPRLLLGTIVPDGNTELIEVRDRLLTAIGLPAEPDYTYPRPLFL